MLLHSLQMWKPYKILYYPTALKKIAKILVILRIYLFLILGQRIIPTIGI